jgi:1-acyl-sn-glycerol-3-phosphate acyltransferase
VTHYPPWGMLGPAAIARWALRTQTSAVRIEGLENIPASGPVMLVARHFHHLLDGSVLVRYVPRPVHIVVGLDWTADAKQRAWMERACRAAQYPIVLRPATLGERGGYARSEFSGYMRTAFRETTALLRAGRVVLTFPEGYPNIDPAFARKANDDTFLPFAPGYQRMIAHAERDGVTRVAVIPVGFLYTRGQRWSIVARLGTPRYNATNAAIEATVHALCHPERVEGQPRSDDD